MSEEELNNEVENEENEIVQEEEQEQDELQAEGERRDQSSEPDRERAMRDGWVDYEDWVDQGKDPDQWRPASEFNAKGDEIMGVWKKRVERLERDLQEQRKASAAAFEAQQKAHEDELKKARAKAIELGDGEKVNEIDDELDEIRYQKRQAKKQPDVDPSVAAFKARNDWYGEDPELTELADGFGYAYRASHPNAEPSEILSHIETKIRAYQRNKTPVNTRRNTPSVEASRKAAPRKKEKTFENLPPEAKRTAESLMSQIANNNSEKREAFKKKFVESYNWD